jgi:hypothetical protein
MYLIAITDWKHKVGVAVRLLLFLLLIWMITPQFFNFISGHLAGFTNHRPKAQSSEMRVERSLKSQPVHLHEDRFLQWLQGYYAGAVKQAPDSH